MQTFVFRSIPLLCLLTLLTGCQEQGVRMTPIVQNAPYTVDLRVESPTAGTVTSLHFDVRFDGAKADLVETERLLHIIYVSEDYKDVYHTFFVEIDGPGAYRVSRALVRPGRYRVWAEIEDPSDHTRHGPNAELIAFTDFTVAGTASDNAPPDRALSKTQSGVTVMLAAPSVRAGAQGTVHISAKDAATGTPFEFPDIEPGLYVVIGPDLSLVWHGHIVDGDAKELRMTHDFEKAGDHLLWIQMFLNEADSYRVAEERFIFEVPAQ